MLDERSVTLNGIKYELKLTDNTASLIGNNNGLDDTDQSNIKKKIHSKKYQIMNYSHLEEVLNPMISYIQKLPKIASRWLTILPKTINAAVCCCQFHF